MNAGPDAAAVRIFAEVLSEFAFLFGELKSPGEIPELQGKAYLAFLPFRGSVAGALSLCVPADLAVDVAANTLGMEPADPTVPAQAQDAVREVASVVGGYLATALESPEAPVTLFPPQILPMNAEDWDRLRRDPGTRCFAVDDRPVLFRVDLGSASI
jgi:chemotaxis protein CheY-P-specific phosphatase CheC